MSRPRKEAQLAVYMQRRKQVVHEEKVFGLVWVLALSSLDKERERMVSVVFVFRTSVRTQ